MQPEVEPVTFLQAVASPLAVLLRTVADWLDGGDWPDEESEPDSPVPQLVPDGRGGFVLR